MIEKMTSIERRAVFSLSAIMGLRMIGLFMVLPIFSLYAHQLSGATPTLIGVAMGIYGLTQAIFQIPFGYMSDRIGRKKIILLGLIIFISGSIIAGLATSIQVMIIGRALQGIGAVGSTILALIADLTRETQRSKAMAIAGISIGFSFSIAMVAGPILASWMSINHLFYLAVMFGLVGVVFLFAFVPTPVANPLPSDKNLGLTTLLDLVITPELAKLNLGIFFLHAIFTASFVVIPLSLLHFSGLQANQQWYLYLPSLLVAFAVAFMFINIAERHQQIKTYFLGSIIAIAIAECLFWLGASLTFSALALCLFFAGFSLLEAFMPSLISRVAPSTHKGSALGIYSCAQFFGIFVGGLLGGWLYGRYSYSGVYLFCIFLSLLWLLIAFLMQPPLVNPDFIRLQEELKLDSV